MCKRTRGSSHDAHSAVVISDLIPALHNRDVLLDAATLEQEFLSRFREARVWDTTTGTSLHTLEGHIAGLQGAECASRVRVSTL